MRYHNMLVGFYRERFLITVLLAWLAVGAHSWSLATSRNHHRIASSRCLSSASSLAEPTQISAATANQGSETLLIADDAEFIKPDRDLRKYRIIQLPNNLRVLLVSTQLTPGSTGVEAASVHVQAGHFDDTIPGLAHFHEHLLFLGTEKYPNEEEYESFLQKYGGFSNAFTDMEDTNYFLSITTEANPDQTSEGLEGALDRLAQFFIAPKFDPDASDREISAIDSEYRNALSSDSWRNFQLVKSTCRDDHPFRKFGCGNKETLTSKGLDHLLGELHNFWKTYYQSFNLRLSVVGHASLDNLQATVERTFGQVPHSNGSPRRIKSLPGQTFVRENAVYNTPAYTSEQLGFFRNIIPLAERRTMKILFATPPLDDPLLDPSMPYRTISHILGHEAPGSLHALLNEEGYIQALSSGVGIDTSDFSLFSLSLSLTPKGMKEKDRVLDYVFQWLALLRENQDKLADYHEELRQISAMNFRFRENGDPTDFASSASELLFEEFVEPGRFLVSLAETSDLNMDAVEAFMERLRPRNCMIFVHNSDLDSSVGEWQQEQWYGAKYQDQVFEPSQVQKWDKPSHYDERLHLPKLNKYIPTDFSLRCDDNNEAACLDQEPNEDYLKENPVLMINNPKLRLWHKMDRYWRVPKTFIRLALLSPKIYSTALTMTYSRIFQRVLSDDLNSFVYDASMAGCNYKVTSTPFGYRISVRGYSEKLPFLLDTLTSRILSLIEDMKQGDPVLQDKFDKARETLLRETKNYRLDPPHELAGYHSRLFLEENVFYLDDYIAELEGAHVQQHPLTMAECAAVVQECFTGRVQCESLCMGNIDEGGARLVADVIDKHFLNTSRGLRESEMPRFRSYKLPLLAEAIAMFGESVIDRPYPLVYQDLAFSESEENNAVEVILQAGSELDLGYEGVATLDFIAHMAYNSAYNMLRTKEQLGYIVSVAARKTAGGAWALSVVVQGSVALPEVLEQRVEAWIEFFRNELAAMSPDEIADEASAVVAQLLEKEQKLSQEVGRVFGEILGTEGLSNRLREPEFDRLERLAETLTVADEEDDQAELTDNEPGPTPESLKERVVAFYDKYFAPSAPQRRSMVFRVYNQNAKDAHDTHIGKPGVLSSYSDMRHMKQYLSTWPTVPYWKTDYKD